MGFFGILTTVFYGFGNTFTKNKRNLCNSETALAVGLITLGLQLILVNYPDKSSTNLDQDPEELGDELYYAKNRLGIHYADYAKSVVYKLVLKPNLTDIVTCDESSHKLHKVGGLPIRNVSLFQSLGDTNIHALGAYLDDRIQGRKVIRILALGLHPGPGDKIYCNYQCSRNFKGFCSAQAFGVILLAGNHTDYKQDWDRKSLQNVISLSCAVSAEDHPQEVSLTLTQCSFSHNVLPVNQMDYQGVAVPPRDVGICVWPLNQSQLDALGITPNQVATWLEYLRRLGADRVFLYTSVLSKSMENLIKFYENEALRLVTSFNWTKVDENVDLVVSDEAAVNHCIYHNMLTSRYIMITSIDQWLAFSGNFEDLKQLSRNEEFQNKMDQFGGFRIRSAGEVKRQMFIVKPKLILATAARHFVALTGRQSFHVIEPTDVVGAHYEDRRLSRAYVQMDDILKELVNDKTEKGNF